MVNANTSGPEDVCIDHISLQVVISEFDGVFSLVFAADGPVYALWPFWLRVRRSQRIIIIIIILLLLLLLFETWAMCLMGRIFLVCSIPVTMSINN